MPNAGFPFFAASGVTIGITAMAARRRGEAKMGKVLTIDRQEYVVKGTV